MGRQRRGGEFLSGAAGKSIGNRGVHERRERDARRGESAACSDRRRASGVFVDLVFPAFLHAALVGEPRNYALIGVTSALHRSRWLGSPKAKTRSGGCLVFLTP